MSNPQEVHAQDPADSPIDTGVRLTSVGNLIDELKHRRADNRELWYRGQPDASWKLLPSVYRDPDYRDYEIGLIERFRQEAAPASLELTLDKWGWIVYAQHFGLPTRLLDWSQSPLIGLYFACEAADANSEEDHTGADGKLYTLCPQILNDWAGQNDGGKPRLLDSSSSDLDGYHPEQTNSSGKPKAVLAPRQFDRVRFQTGTFTVSPPNPRYQALDEYPHVRGLESFTIPSRKKKDILLELESIGIHAASVYRDLDRIAKRIKQETPRQNP